MLVSLAENAVETYPAMIVEKVGYGAGSKELSAAPNLLRVVIGRTPDHSLNIDSVHVLETNLDDLPGEILGNTLQRLLDVGARDAWITDAQFKKNRPGHVLHVLCDSKDVPTLVDILIRETGTLGVRYHEWKRFILRRDVRNMSVRIGGQDYEVRVKIARDESGRILRAKPEFDDIVAIAKMLSRPVREIADIVASETREVQENK